jgi:hypothetical protein
MPESIMYVPSYLLAAVRDAELKKIEELYEENWWESEEAEKYLRRIMKDGSKY